MKQCPKQLCKASSRNEVVASDGSDNKSYRSFEAMLDSVWSSWTWKYWKIDKAHTQSHEKIKKTWNSPQAENSMKILPGMFCSGAGERLPFNISPYLLLFTEHEGLSLKDPPMGSISSVIPWGRGEAAWILKRNSLQVAMWGCWLSSPPWCPTLWGQLAAFLEFQPKLVGEQQVLAIPAHPRMIDSSFQRTSDELLWVDQTN